MLNGRQSMISSLSARELKHLVKGQIVIPSDVRNVKDKLQNYIADHASAEVLHIIQNAVEEKHSDQLEKEMERKRKRVESQFIRRKAIKVDELDDLDDEGQREIDTSKFMELPSEDQVRQCYRNFYEATSNKALAMTVCSVCALEVSWITDGVEVMAIEDIPNAHRLVPSQRHGAQRLFQGMLLEPMGVSSDLEGSISVNVCRRCHNDLRRKSEIPPRFSLANGLWIGDVPWELRRLTFPEQMLIALLYPRVYVFKLYTKSIHQPGYSSLQRGLRGTVCTFELDIDAIASMVQGKLMPRQTTFLPTIISVTFVGKGKLPLEKLRNLFSVRRQVVLEALVWLKNNNPRYYGNIHIDMDRIGELPEDDIPVEITSSIRQTTDIGLIDQEESGYTPEHQPPTSDIEPEDPSLKENILEQGTDSGDPAIIPLNVVGMVDSDMLNVTGVDMMKRGLLNLLQERKRETYAVHYRDLCHSVSNIKINAKNAYSVPNFFERAFPCLFPYGRGGIESDRPVPIAFGDHIKWALQYHDRRFRKHETFPFVCFSIQQRRETLGSARLQMERKNFEQDAHIIATVTKEKLAVACREEEQKKPISDPAVRLLRRHVHITAERVKGSNQSRYQMRSQIWSTIIYQGPPNLWITINPSDLHDPIAQVFAGESIDLDAFVKSAGPNATKRAKNVADDPYAASKFFHFLIKTIIETLFSIKIKGNKIKSTMGILGRLSAYFGLVECQGRGTLHLHMLIWLANAPPADQIQQELKSPVFRSRIIAYIQANLRAYLPGLESLHSVQKVPLDLEAAYSRPPNPNSSHYDEEIQNHELRLARTEQLHTCRLRRCLVLNFKDGQIYCKRRAPFKCSPTDFIEENGEWGPKRLYEYINNWVPGILINARCNNDGKLLTNGEDTKNITYYVTNYAAKKQGKSYNLAAVMAQGYAYHIDHPKPEYLDQIKNQSRLLLFRLVHAINREQEFASPMVISYLMAWGDAYKSHTYSPIYWNTFNTTLLRAFPSLIQQSKYDVKSQIPFEQTNVPPYNITQRVWNAKDNSIYNEQEVDNDLLTLDINSTGQIFSKSQVTDYQCRGPELEDYNVLQFFMDTYEEHIGKKEKDEADCDLEEVDDRRHPGRPRHIRIQYQSQHPRYKQRQRVLRIKGHRNLPNFIGHYFPRQDDPEIYEYYCATMLLLLKPWRSIQHDIKSENESWEEAFIHFKDNAPYHIQSILAGIQYFHESNIAGKEDRKAIRTQDGDDVGEYLQDDIENEIGEVDEAHQAQMITTDEMDAIVSMGKNVGEELHAHLAMEIARQHGVFSSIDTSWLVEAENRPHCATGGDIQHLYHWRQQMQEDVMAQNNHNSTAGWNIPEKEHGGVQRLDQYLNEASIISTQPSVALLPEKGTIQSTPSWTLNKEQQRAYDIINQHLRDTLNDKKQPPLRMIMYGAGGVGKSRVIHAVTKAFDDAGVTHMLVKAAYTAIAASLVKGKTTHNIGALTRRYRGKVSNRTKMKLQEFWKDKTYLIIDEFSMISKSFLARLSKNISIGKQGSNTEQPGHSFGGVNVILCGDLHQFPPVAQKFSEHLFRPKDPERDSLECQIGRTIYEEFTTVVVLRQQMRVTDPTWQNMLNNLRRGQMQQQDLDVLHSLVIGNETNTSVDFNKEPWNTATLITPRHSVRNIWNEYSIKRWCQLNRQHLFVCRAEDNIGDRQLSAEEQYALAIQEAQKTDGQDLPRKIELAIGMKMILTINMETDLDITNGATGEIVDIILHPDEPPIGNEPVVELKFLPLYVLVKLSRTRASKLRGLPEAVVPIEPTQGKIKIKIPSGKKGNIPRIINRKQFSITGAYAFTDYRAQGQTIPYAIVDIAKPPTGGLSLFNLYVALSRSSGRNTIRLLRDFDDDIFIKAHDPLLIEEDERLDQLDEKTKKHWEETHI